MWNSPVKVSFTFYKEDMLQKVVDANNFYCAIDLLDRYSLLVDKVVSLNIWVSDFKLLQSKLEKKVYISAKSLREVLEATMSYEHFENWSASKKQDVIKANEFIEDLYLSGWCDKFGVVSVDF